MKVSVSFLPQTNVNKMLFVEHLSKSKKIEISQDSSSKIIYKNEDEKQIKVGEELLKSMFDASNLIKFSNSGKSFHLVKIKFKRIPKSTLSGSSSWNSIYEFPGFTFGNSVG